MPLGVGETWGIQAGGWKPCDEPGMMHWWCASTSKAKLTGCPMISPVVHHKAHLMDGMPGMRGCTEPGPEATIDVIQLLYCLSRPSISPTPGN